MLEFQARIAHRPSWLALPLATLMCFGICISPAAIADAYPSRPIKIVVPYAPGGGNDLLARIFSEKLSARVGQPVLVDNKAGAAAILGTDLVAKSPPDGYTLLMAANGPIVFNPALYSQLPYSSTRDLVAISIAGTFPLFLAVHENFPARTLPELIAYSKANPGKSNYSYPAASFQLIMELLKSRSGLKALNVPYQGAAPSIHAVLTGEVQMTLIDSGPIASLIKAGRLHGLAVTSEQRLPAFPEIPTLREQGLDLAVYLWSGLFAPAGTPAEIVQRLQQEMVRIMGLPEVVERLQKLEIRAMGNTSAEFAAMITKEIELWSSVARANNIKAN